MRTGRSGLLMLAGAAALAAPPAAAFVRTLSAPEEDGGIRHYTWWPTREVSYRIQSDCAPMNPAVVAAGEGAAVFGQLCRDAIIKSFQAWHEAGADAGQPPCTDMVLRRDGDIAVREVGYDATDPNEGNSVIFQPQECLGLVPLDDPCWDDDSCEGPHACFAAGPEVLAHTVTTIRSSDGVILDADIEVNAGGGQDFSAEVGSPLSDTADIQDTVTHEVGHLLGLDHNCGFSGAPACTAELMQGAMYNGRTPGEIVKRTLKGDDIAGVCHIYPTGVDTQTVNLADGPPPDVIPGKTGSCASIQGPPNALGLALALLLVRRRQRP